MNLILAAVWLVVGVAFLQYHWAHPEDLRFTINLGGPVSTGWFALLYGVFRFAVEFVRVPDAQLEYLALGWVTMGQLLSLPLVAVGLFWLWLSRRSPTRSGTSSKSWSAWSRPARVLPRCASRRQ